MKAISYSGYGGPEVLEYGEARDPKVGPDSVLVKVRAAAVNPVDWKAREGYLDPALDAVFPVIPGWDVSGVVVQPGASVTEFVTGDEVIGYVREDFLSRGTFAEYVAAPVRTLARKPRNLTYEEAAGLPLAGLTAYQVMTGALAVQDGDVVLVHAAAAWASGRSRSSWAATWAPASSARRASATTTSCGSWAPNPSPTGKASPNACGPSRRRAWTPCSTRWAGRP